jgi:hypothetical protein
MKEEHWRIIIADMECPFRQPLDKFLSNEICFCSKKKDPKERLVEILNKQVTEDLLPYVKNATAQE